MGMTGKNQVNSGLGIYIYQFRSMGKQYGVIIFVVFYPLQKRSRNFTVFYAKLMSKIRVVYADNVYTLIPDFYLLCTPMPAKSSAKVSYSSILASWLPAT